MFEDGRKKTVRSICFFVPGWLGCGFARFRGLGTRSSLRRGLYLRSFWSRCRGSFCRFMPGLCRSAVFVLLSLFGFKAFMACDHQLFAPFDKAFFFDRRFYNLRLRSLAARTVYLTSLLGRESKQVIKSQQGFDRCFRRFDALFR